jgi:NDP-hexose-3-ketoreductase
LLEHPDVDAVYMPLPTGLHAEWCAKALAAGKHLLVEKSFASNYASAHFLVEQARGSGLLVAENFQFQTHRQWATIEALIEEGRLGRVHLVRSTFGFPPLPKENFRWNRRLGGGALLDAGAYVAKVSRLLLGPGLEVMGASQTVDPATGVDVYGEAMFKSHSGQISQVAYGFDYFYQCRVEILGTDGKLTASRVFTAPPGLDVELTLETPAGTELVRVGADNHYVNMWRRFATDLQGGDFSRHWDAILEQARLLNEMSISDD